MEVEPVGVVGLRATVVRQRLRLAITPLSPVRLLATISTAAAVVITAMPRWPIIITVVVVVVAVARSVVMVTVDVSATRLCVAVVTAPGVLVVVRLLMVVMMPADVIVDDVMVDAVLVRRHVVLMLQRKVDVTRVVTVFRHHRYNTTQVNKIYFMLMILCLYSKSIHTVVYRSDRAILFEEPGESAHLFRVVRSRPTQLLWQSSLNR